MKKNVGNLDKLIRLILAVVIFLFIYKGGEGNTTLDIVWLVVAFVLALTSLLNYCPVYSLLGINTNKTKQ